MLEAGTALLIEAGPRSVTVDAVSQRSGVAKSTLYRHWASREELLIDILRNNEPDMPSPAQDLCFVDALHEVVRGMAAAFGNPEWCKVLPVMLSMRSHMPEVAEILDADHEEHKKMFAGVLDRGKAEGVLPDDLDPELVLQLLIGPILFAALTEQKPVEEVAEYVVDRFLASYK